MRRNRAHWIAGGLLAALTAYSALASAQVPDGEAPPAAPAAGEGAVPPPPPPPPPPKRTPVVHDFAATPAAAPARPKRPRSGAAWYQMLKYRAFVDAYFGMNYLFPKPETNGFPRVFDSFNGFALSWFGADMEYTPGGILGPVGATISLRGGPTAVSYAGADAALGLAAIKQAFVVFEAAEGLTIDFGKFDTVFGAEVAESHLNHSYTRGALFGLLQPNFHTGLRVNWALNPALQLRFLAVNGWNNSADNNRMKTFGLQLNYQGAGLRASFGYLFGPELDGINDEFRHFFDLIVGLEAGRFDFWLNADFLLESFGGATAKAFGVASSGRYRFTDVWAGALRLEYVGDFDGLLTGGEQSVLTLTITIDAAIGRYALIRLDNRLDIATEGKPFRQSDNDASSVQATTTLGIVFKTE